MFGNTSVKHSLAWAGYKFASTVLDDIWPQALFFTGIAVMVTVVSKLTGTQLGMNSTMLTVLGTVVSLVVSFKTNNSYLRWWEGRNIWSNITSNSRQLAMIIWLQVPNTPQPKDEEKKDDKAKPKPPTDKDGSSKRHSCASSSEAPEESSHPIRNWHTKGDHNPHDPGFEPLLAFEDGEHGEHKPASVLSHSEEEGRDEAEENRKKAEEEKQAVHGLIEKKTYIGLIQAFAVAMKHSLRGEAGPFYYDLYNLIAFLPKYNPAACPPVTRDHLLVLWQNGIPRQKWHKADDVMAVPLTQPAVFDGYAFEMLNGAGTPTPGPIDKESNPSGLTTTSSKFKDQAVNSAAQYFETNDPTVLGSSRLDHRDHRLCRDSSPPNPSDRNRSNAPEKPTEKVTITTVELLPARHPPSAQIWDFFPPLRIFKVIWDWFKTQKRLEEQERARGGKRRRAGAVKSEIPQEIVMYLFAYVADLARRSDMNTSFISPLMTALMELQKSVSDLDKIATTPIPSAYSFHLRLTVWAYLFFLPFQIYTYIGWLTIPATAVASITYLGFLEIGAQIEMPFGYEQSDLDLDKFVLKITQQLAQVTAFPTAVSAKNIVLSHLNQPFLPSLSLSAPELLGVPEPAPNPTTMGFAAAYPDPDANNHDDKKNSSKPSKASQDESNRLPLPKTMRNLEITLNANWRDIAADTKKYIGKQRDQLENKTGMEIAVLAL